MLKAAAISLFLFVTVLPQGQRPPRDARVPATTGGNGTIYGTVFGSSSGPLPATTVVLSSRSLNQAWRVFTNEAGAFRFEGLPEGDYTLTASHPQYLPAHYGQTFVGQEGRTLRLSAGESTRADLVAVRGSAISGQVLDIYGNPAMDVLVQAYRAEKVAGRRQLQAVAARTYRSNDIGHYRISNLVPGTYYLAAQPLLRDVAGPSQGSAPGFAVTWYPGTLRAAEAQPVRVGAEAELPLPPMGLVPVALTYVSGSISLPPGVAKRDVILQLVPDSEIDFAKQLRGAIDDNGRFLFERVPPGSYVLFARSGGEPHSRGPGPTLTKAFYGRTTVQVIDRAVEGVSLVLSPPRMISGKVTSDTPIPDLSRVLITTNYDGEHMGYAASAAVNPAGTFQVPTAPGRVRLSVSGLPPGWIVEQIRGAGRDLEVEGADTGNGGLFGVVVSVSSRAASISGVVRVASNDDHANGTVVVMTAEPQFRTPLRAGVVSARLDSRGAFSINGLRPGRYIVAVVDFIAPSQYYDPAIWDRLESDGQTLDISRGEAVTLSPPFVKLLR